MKEQSLRDTGTKICYNGNAARLIPESQLRLTGCRFILQTTPIDEVVMPKYTIRKLRIENDLVYVPLTKGYEAIIDLIDIQKIEGFNWYAAINGRMVYAGRRIRIEGKQTNLPMHRVIAETPTGIITDHIDGNGLNNTRQNLRWATNAQNQYNKRMSCNNKSGFKGVWFDKTNVKWMARIAIHGKRTFLGLFDNPEDAHKAYCDAANELFGEFARYK